MPQYMLLMYQPVDGGPASGDWAAEQAKWSSYGEEIHAAGVVLSNSGLKGIDAATTVRVRDGESQLTDGPFAETKEYLAGYFLIDTPDLDGALDWASRVPSATYGSVEVRPVWGS